MTRPIVFIGYSHKDEEEKEQLLSHLGILRHAGLIDLWSDDQIGAGADWEAEISWAIARARVAVLLISANFLTSDFILRKEVPELLKRRQSEGLIVFPVIARDCAWQTVDWLRQMKIRPQNARPVWGDRGSHIDEDLAVIVREIAGIIEKTDNSPNAITTSSYREIAEEIAEVMKEPDERLLTGEQSGPLDDSDYREIAEEIAEVMKEPDERLLSSEQPRPLGDSDYREIADGIAEETKERDERLPNSPRSNSQAARSFVIKEWLIARSSGVLDEIIAGLIIAGILALFGVVSGVLEGTPVAWLADSGSIWYLVVSIALIGVALIAYVAWRRKRR